jgi:branched-chain amino acid transport system permease protein
MVLIPTLQLGPWDLSGNTTTFLYIAIGAVIFSAVAMRWLMSSTFGLGVRAMRDYEEYALSRGVPVARHRIQIIAVSSMFASGAGALFALYTGVASPDLFGFSTSTLLLTMVILGGIGSVYGPVVGAVAVTAFVNIPQIAALNTETYLITGALILVILWILPGGLWSVLRRARAGRRGVVEY